MSDQKEKSEEDNKSKRKIAYDLYYHILRTLIYDGYLEPEEISRAYHRNMYHGYKFMEGKEGYTHAMNARFGSPEVPGGQVGQDIGKIVSEISSVDLTKVKKCPMLYSAYISNNPLPLKHDYDIIKKLICMKEQCALWDEKRKKCTKKVHAPGGISKKNIMEIVEKIRKPVEYILYPECLKCGNWDTIHCKTCGVSPKNYIDREEKPEDLSNYINPIEDL